MTRWSVLLICLLIAPATAQAATFTSPHGVEEECRILPHIPGGLYSPDDVRKEEAYCAIDFNDAAKVALCPKTWSTSPGTMVEDITASGMSQARYETQSSCGGAKSDRTLVKFKQTMNQSGTSGTFSPSALLYYHFSRYFDTSVDIPVAVYRSMDKDSHFSRVTRRAWTGKMGKSAMNRAGWQWLYRAEQQPALYVPPGELFTPDRRQIFGVLLGGGGERYGPEINGIRSKWGDAQNNDFQNTPAFLALRSGLPLKEAMHAGLQAGDQNPQLARAMGGGASEFQMAVWMQELTEITILDYLFSQQDRVGNIDYKWEVYSVDAEGKTEARKLDSKVPRTAMKTLLATVGPDADHLVQKTQMSDNDAGGRNYVNYTKRTGMLPKLRHLNAGTYRKLIGLNRDLQTQGEIYQYVRGNFNLSAPQLAQLVTYTLEAATLLEASCKAGQLRFDLFPPGQWLKAAPEEERADCQPS